MSLFLLLIIPAIIGAIGLAIGKGTITWKEFLTLEAVIIIIITVSFYSAAAFKSKDKEIWNGTIANKEMQKVSDCHSYPCNCKQVCSGSGEDESCYTRCDTCYRHSHDLQWSAKTTNGEIAYYDSCNPPGTPEPKRYTDIIVGEPTSIEHSYTNYIKGNQDTILKRELKETNFNIPTYPEVYDNYRVKRFLGIGIKEDFTELDNKLDKINGTLGASKQVNMTVLIVNETNQLYFEKLKEEWLGGKKNDFVVVIGTPNYPEIAWANVMSWTDSEDAKVFTKNRILEMKEFNGEKVLKIIEEEVATKYKRKEMKDFEYLKLRIEPSFRAKLIIFIISIIASISITYWSHKEDLYN